MKKLILFCFSLTFFTIFSSFNAVAKTYKFEKCFGEGDNRGISNKWSKESWQKDNLIYVNLKMVESATNLKELENSVYYFPLSDDVWKDDVKPKKFLKKLNKENPGWKMLPAYGKNNYTLDTSKGNIVWYRENSDKYISTQNILNAKELSLTGEKYARRFFPLSRDQRIIKFSITDNFDDYVRGSTKMRYGDDYNSKLHILFNFKTGKIEIKNITYFPNRTHTGIRLYVTCKPLNYSSLNSSGTFSKTFSYWWVVFILIALGGFIYTQLKPGKSKKVKIPKAKISFQKNPIFTFLPKLWRGEFPLAISFWACWIIPSMFFSLVVLVPVTGTAEIILGYFILFFYIYAFIAIRGTWYSANHYKAEKEKKNQTYGWASAAHIYIFLSVLGFIFRIFKLIL